MILTAFVVLFGLAVASPASALEFSTEEKARLREGEMVIRLLPTSGKKGFYGGSGYVVIDSPVDEVWKTLLNWSIYPDIFPHTKECTPLSRKGQRTLVKMVIGHPVARVQFHLNIVTNEKEKTLQFDLVPNYPSDLEMLQGFWRLFPQPGGRTLAAYVVSSRAPMGLVILVGPELARSAIEMLLSIPGDVRKYMQAHESH